MWLDIFGPCRSLVYSISTMKVLHKTGTVSLNRIRPPTSLLETDFFLRIPVEGLLFYAVCWLLPTLFGSATPTPDTDTNYVVVKAFRMDFVLPADLCNNTRIYAYFIFLTIRTYFNVWYFRIRVWSSIGQTDGRTDGQTTYHGITALCYALRGKNKTCTVFLWTTMFIGP